MKNTLTSINSYAEVSTKEFVDFSEACYYKEIEALADIISNNDDIKIVSIAGPSGSGKTTTAHILYDLLIERNETPTVVSLDDFYLPGELLPILPNGKTDIESVNSLDVSLIGKCFNEIIKTGESVLPTYDFKTRSRNLNGKKVDIKNHGIIICEGLHALNPLITDLIPRKNIYKIYISVNTPILDDNGETLLSSRQIRLIRRALRDRIFRGSSINTTLSLWDGVIEGERKYLYCFKETADAQLKTLHLYEPLVYKKSFLELENDVAEDAPCYEYFIKTVRALKQFNSISSDFVPNKSLIREFIGNGKYNTPT